MSPKYLICLLALPLLVQAQVPDWVKNQGKGEKYPESRYLTGFGVAKVDKNTDKAQASQFASDYAKKNLI